MISFCHRSVLLALCGALLATGASGTQAAPADAPEGTWAGTVDAPQGESAAIGFEFFRSPAGALDFRIYFPVMSLHAARLGLPVESDGDAYAIAAPLHIRFRREDDRLTGSFGADRLPLTLVRNAGLPPRPETPAHPPAPAPRWKYSLGAGTWAPPVADGDTVFIGASDGRFHAVHSADGASAWVWPGNIPIDGAAALDTTNVYFMDTRYNLVALDRQTGAFRWRTPLHNEFLAGHSAPDNPAFNHRAATPLPLDGAVYVGSSDGGLYALSPANGAVLWRHEAGAPIYSGLGLHGPDTLLFGTMDGSVVALDRRTQCETMRVKTGGGVVTTPMVAGGLLIAGSRDYNLHAFNLHNGSVAWKFSCWFSWIESTPALRDGLLYFGSSDYARVTALDPASGRARWSAPVHGLSWGTPLVTDRYVFAGTVNQNLPGTLIEHSAGLVKLDRATGAVLWRLTLPKAESGRFAGYAGSLALAGTSVIAAGFDGWLTAWPVE
jgi:outer membrane protein assembly factor BamB